MGAVEDGNYVPGSWWFYAPNHVAPIVFAALFNMSMYMHIWQTYRYGSWRFTSTIAWSAVLFVTGYILRSIGSWHNHNLNLYIASTIFLYSAPPFYELSNYFILSRVLHYIPHHSPIHPGRIRSLFLSLSVVVEVLTIQGAIRASNQNGSPEAMKAGKVLVKVALVLQLVILGVFVTVTTAFYRNTRRAGAISNAEPGRNVKAVLITLYISSALIGARTIYRTVEYFMLAGIHVTATTTIHDISPVVRYEWFYWVFEAIPMIINSWTLNARHPGKYLPSNVRVYQGEDGLEREGVGMMNQRTAFQRITDPYDIKGLILRRDKKWWVQEDRVDAENVPIERK